MFNNNFSQDNFDNPDSGFIPSDFAGFIPNTLDSFNADLFSRDFQGFPLLSEYETLDPANLLQMFDQAYQFFPDEIKQFIPFGFDYPMPTGENFEAQLPKFTPKPYLKGPGGQIGTISIEERRIKVQKFLEKRKKRNFGKKISYMCRKKVADQRVRIKGRFVSKVQASALMSEKLESDQI